MTSNPCFLSHGGKTRAVRNIGYWVGRIDGGGGKLVLNILKYYLSEIKVSSLEILVKFSDVYDYFSAIVNPCFMSSSS